MRADGQVTREGAYYYSLSGEQDGDRRFDPNQPVSRRGNTEYILDRSRREVALLPFSQTEIGRTRAPG